MNTAGNTYFSHPWGFSQFGKDKPVDGDNTWDSQRITSKIVFAPTQLSTKQLV